MKSRFIALVLAFAALVGCHRAANDDFDAETLCIDNRYSTEVAFVSMNISVPLPPHCYVRYDGLVSDTHKHIEEVLREFHVKKKPDYSNSAAHGATAHLTFRDGNQCSIVCFKPDDRSRVTHMSWEHEKYHVIHHLAPGAVDSLSQRILQLGFAINLAELDEELAATVIEVLDLKLGGVDLNTVSGSEYVEAAVSLLKSQQVKETTTD